jgi:hypothetical protein
VPGYERVLTGDIVLGHDGELWGVAGIQHAPQLAVTLTRYGTTVTGYPPAGTPVTVVQPAGVQAFIDAGLAPEFLGEMWV